jgi:hypothetical protein
MSHPYRPKEPVRAVASAPEAVLDQRMSQYPKLRQTIVLPLLVAREFHAFTFVFNGELDYANIGHSVFSDDGGHFYAGGGFKVVIGR